MYPWSGSSGGEQPSKHRARQPAEPAPGASAPNTGRAGRREPSFGVGHGWSGMGKLTRVTLVINLVFLAIAVVNIFIMDGQLRALSPLNQRCALCGRPATVIKEYAVTVNGQNEGGKTYYFCGPHGADPPLSMDESNPFRGYDSGYAVLTGICAVLFLAGYRWRIRALQVLSVSASLLLLLASFARPV